MVENTHSGMDAGLESVGKVAVLYGTVQAATADGMARALALNSPVYMGDHITTGPDGTVLIIFDADQAHLDLGRMSSAFIDQDVAGGISAADVRELAADIAEISLAMEQGDIDRILDMPSDLTGDAGNPDAVAATETLSDESATGTAENREGNSTADSEESHDHPALDSGTGGDSVAGVARVDDATAPDSHDLAAGEADYDSGADLNIDDLVPPPDSDPYV